MFKIRTRIDDEELKNISLSVFNEEWGNVEGFIEVTIGEATMGYYHEGSLHPNVPGCEWITWWLSLFLDCADMITKTSYVAFSKPEEGSWLEFVLRDDVVIFNNALEPEQNYLRGITQYKKNYHLSYWGPRDMEVGLNDFLKEIYRATESFLDELKSINPQLIESEVVKGILELYEKRHQHCKKAFLKI